MQQVLILLLFLNATVLNAQIYGQVKDFKSQKPLKGAEIFVDGGLTKAVSDENGYFILEGLQSGTLKIACFKKGYRTDAKVLSVKKGENIVLFILKKNYTTKKIKDKAIIAEVISNAIQQNELFPEWDQKLVTRTVSLKAQDSKIFGMITFQNLALGYAVEYHLLDYTGKTSNLLTKFTPLRGSESDENLWAENRFARFKLTANNFLESVLQNTNSVYGYHVFDVNNQIQMLDNQLTIGLSGENNILKLDQQLKIIFTVDGKTHNSWIEANGRVVFDDNGLIQNKDSVKLTGTFADKSLSGLLPLEYSPPLEWKRFNLEPYFEKAYVHTDKPYYLPGDTVWFKVYMNYKTLPLIESLSKVLYVDLIESKNDSKPSVTNYLKIEDGEAWGEFVLPETLTSDFIALRAYTNWQRNYGADQIFLKYFPVVQRSVNLRNQRTDFEKDNNVLIYFDKPGYSKRDKIRLTVSVVDENNTPSSAWMSVSVTDLSMVRVLQDSLTITKSFEIKPYPIPSKIKYPIEQGLSLNARFISENNKPIEASLTLMSEKFTQAFEFNTDIYGKFSIHGLDFTDSATVRYSAKNDSFQVFGKIEILREDPLPLELKWPKPSENIEKADFKIDKNTTLLREVIVEAKRIAVQQKKTEQDKIKRIKPFGEPNYVLEGNRLRRGAVNVIEMMRGQIPGLAIGFNGANYSIRFTRSGSISLDTSPAVFIDDIPTGGNIEPTLLAINPFDVAAIEFITRLTSVGGAQGANGIIAIYTRAGGLRGRFIEDEKLKMFSLKGYATPSRFSGIDHQKAFVPQNSDFRSTIYWSPSVVSSRKAGPARVDFFASDSAGPYLITIEGVTDKGKPFRHEQLLELSSED